MNHTILADNSALNSGPDCPRTITSQGYNLIEDTNGCVIAGDTTGNILEQDPVLGPLQDNGGQTEIHAPGPGRRRP